MKASEILDRLQEKFEVSTDYAVHQLLVASGVRVSQATVYNWRNGRQMEDQFVVQIAPLIGRNPDELLALVQIERTKCPEAKAAFERLAHLARSAAAAVVIGVSLSFMTTYATYAQAAGTVDRCILCKIARRGRNRRASDYFFDTKPLNPFSFLPLA